MHTSLPATSRRPASALSTKRSQRARTPHLLIDKLRRPGSPAPTLPPHASQEPYLAHLWGATDSPAVTPLATSRASVSYAARHAPQTSRSGGGLSRPQSASGLPLPGSDSNPNNANHRNPMLVNSGVNPARVWIQTQLEGTADVGGRQASIKLQQWLLQSLSNVLPAGWNEHSPADVAALLQTHVQDDGVHDLFSRCVQELVKQITASCAEQGQLLAFIWSTYVRSLRDTASANGAPPAPGSSTAAAPGSEAVAPPSVAATCANGPASPSPRANPRMLTKAQSFAVDGRRNKGFSIASLDSAFAHGSSRQLSLFAMSKADKGDADKSSIHAKQKAQRRWKKLATATSALGHWIGKTNGVGADSVSADSREFVMDRSTVLRYIRELLDQMTSFKRLRNIIFSEFTVETEIDEAVAATEQRMREENRYLNKLAAMELGSDPAALQRLSALGYTTPRHHQAAAVIQRAVRQRLLEPARAAVLLTVGTDPVSPVIADIDEHSFVDASGTTKVLDASQPLSGRTLEHRFEDPQRIYRLKQVASDDFQAEMGAFHNLVSDYGNTHSLNERRLASILEEVVWETKQFVRDVAAAWFKRSQDLLETTRAEMQQQATAELRQLQAATDELLEAVDAYLRGHEEHGRLGAFTQVPNSDTLESGVLQVFRALHLHGHAEAPVRRVLQAVQTWEHVQQEYESSPHQDHTAARATATKQLLLALGQWHEWFVGGVRPLMKDEGAQTDPVQFVDPDAPSGKPGKGGKGQNADGGLAIPKGYKPRMMGLSALLAFIDDAYANKLLYDDMDDRDGNPRHALSEFVFEHMFRKYGLRKLAQTNLFDVVASVTHWKSKHARIRLFGRFLGVACRPLPVEALSFMLMLLKQLRVWQDTDSTLSRQLRSLNAITEARCQELVKIALQVLLDDSSALVQTLHIDAERISTRMTGRVRLFADSFAASRNRSVRRASDGSPTPARRSSVVAEPEEPDRLVDVDELLDFFVEEFLALRRKLEEQLIVLFNDGDDNSDGVLTFNEFERVARKAKPSVSDAEVMAMFNEALAETEASGSGAAESDAVTGAAFVKVAQAHGLLVAPRVAPRVRSLATAVRAVMHMRNLAEDHHGEEADVPADPTGAHLRVDAATAAAAEFEAVPGDAGNMAEVGPLTTMSPSRRAGGWPSAMDPLVAPAFSGMCAMLPDVLDAAPVAVTASASELNDSLRRHVEAQEYQAAVADLLRLLALWAPGRVSTPTATRRLNGPEIESRLSRSDALVALGVKSPNISVPTSGLAAGGGLAAARRRSSLVADEPALDVESSAGRRRRSSLVAMSALVAAAVHQAHDS